MAGYIKDHRKELVSDIWQMPPLYHRVWQYLKYKVNYEDTSIPMRDGTRFFIKAGQYLTSLRSIARDVGWHENRSYKAPNPKTISTILTWLEKQRMISIDCGRGNREYTLITLINWTIYQHDGDTSNAKVTDRTQLVDIENKNKEFNTITTAPIEPIDFGKRDSENKPPIIQIIDAYCELHGKLDFHIREKERMLMKQVIALGMPTPLIIKVMRQVYEERHTESNITSFLYYEKPLIEAWNAERSITDEVPALAVAIGTSFPRKYPAAAGKSKQEQKNAIAKQKIREAEERERNRSTEIVFCHPEHV